MDDPPHPKQKQFVTSPHKRKIIRAGRRGGKTVGSAIMAVLAFLEGKSVDYGAPVIDQSSKFWHEVVMALAEPLEFGVFRKIESERKIFKPGTEPEQYIHCHTVWNPDVMRGGSTDLLILDEFQLMNEETWELVCLPRLTDRNGDAVLIYTPPSLRMRAKTNARDPLHASKMFKKYKDDPRWLCLHFTSHDNPNISEEGIRQVSGDLTQMAYRQEIMAEDIEEVPGALWKFGLIDKLRVTEPPREALPFLRIVVGIDPSGSSTNEAGVVAAAKGRNGHGYVLADKSLLATTPRAWAQAACSVYHELQADRIVAERNFGGDMVLEVIRTVDDLVSYKDVVASRGKQVRAEPIFALYEKEVIHHLGVFPELEEEMCSYVPGITKRSPNRMDACFVAGTMISTADGEIPIELVRPGMMVHTRRGLQRVINAGSTGMNSVISRSFPNGRAITATPSHPVFTVNRGFVDIDALVWYDTVLCIEKSVSLMASASYVIRKAAMSDSAAISPEAKRERPYYFTAKYGKHITDLFLQGMIFTTRTRMPLTTASIISNAFLRRHITPTTIKANRATDEDCIWMKSDFSRRYGIVQRAVGNGTVITANAHGSIGSQPCSPVDAINAGRGLKHSWSANDFAAGDVSSCLIGRATDITSKFHAQPVDASFGRGNIITRHGLVPRNAVGRYSVSPPKLNACKRPGDYVGIAEVFNLEVEDQHEYFANGVLVHNCVWAFTELYPESARLGIWERL